MMERPFPQPEESHTREYYLPDAAIDCAHLALRPHPVEDAYVCDTCNRELTPLEAEEVSSEATVRTCPPLP